jgi:hypothetical protein
LAFNCKSSSFSFSSFLKALKKVFIISKLFSFCLSEYFLINNSVFQYPADSLSINNSSLFFFSLSFFEKLVNFSFIELVNCSII